MKGCQCLYILPSVLKQLTLEKHHVEVAAPFGILSEGSESMREKGGQPSSDGDPDAD